MPAQVLVLVLESQVLDNNTGPMIIAINENKHGIIDILHAWLLCRVSTDT